MKLDLKKPLVFFDLETTGLNIGIDKIVEICLYKVNPDYTTEVYTEQLNPEMHIPESVSEIHGIYDKDVVNKPTFKQVAPIIADFLKGCDLAGYNLLKFDLPLLVEEFLRIDSDLDLREVKVIDVQNIFHKMEPRTLKAAYRFYCNESLENAHTAEADTIATFKILEAQVEKYQNTLSWDEKEREQGICPIENNVAKLATYSAVGRNVDFAGHIVFNEKDEEVFNFGKHKGKSVEHIFTIEPSYYDWMMKADFPLYTKKVIHNIRLRMLSNKLSKR
ncbi:MAG: ribonuclease H-like domain-containing protein [Bacteroidales bacterium]|nr:ribonuclease H-like domain-containing protein [Bacteroidales bacterium]